MSREKYGYYTRMEILIKANGAANTIEKQNQDLFSQKEIGADIFRS